MFPANTNTRVFIVGDKEVFPGDMMDVLGRVRAAGIQNVAFQVKEPIQSGPAAARPTGTEGRLNWHNSAREWRISHHECENPVD